MFTFSRFNLSRQFLLACFFILLIGMIVIGTWVGWQIEIGVANRTAAITALYVDSFISPHLQSLAYTDKLNVEHLASLDALLTNTPLGQRIVTFKVWGSDGTILYSTNPSLIGRKFPITAELAHAFSGEVQTEISNLTEPENEFERGQWSRLIETYAPVRKVGTSTVVAVSEFYQTTEDLEREVRAAQMHSWLVVSATTIVIYLLLTGLVGRASNTIVFQQSELRDKVAQLSTMLMQNEQLHNRVSRAAARTTALNERFLRRIATDLHDGPGQDLALALLRIDELAEICTACMVPKLKRRAASDDFGTIQSALRSALDDMRAILAGLRLPEIGQLTIAETAERAIRDFERKTEARVALAVGSLPAEASLSVKITLYRILQESLANSFRHAGGASQRVNIAGKEGQLIVKISDDGPGFNERTIIPDTHLGLVGMRERVEILGGTFEVKSAPNKGTLIRACLPLTLLDVDDE